MFHYVNTEVLTSKQNTVLHYQPRLVTDEHHKAYSEYSKLTDNTVLYFGLDCLRENGQRG
jgi:hypothetical protein